MGLWAAAFSRFEIEDMSLNHTSVTLDLDLPALLTLQGDLRTLFLWKIISERKIPDSAVCVCRYFTGNDCFLLHYGIFIWRNYLIRLHSHGTTLSSSGTESYCKRILRTACYRFYWPDRHAGPVSDSPACFTRFRIDCFKKRRPYLWIDIVRSPIKISGRLYFWKLSRVYIENGRF